MKNFIETMLSNSDPKIKRKEKRKQKELELNSRLMEQPTINYQQWIEGKDKHLIIKIMEGRCLKPCDRECEEYALFILKQFNHGSLKNFTYIMNDREFLIKSARITENPMVVENYFYQYINSYLKNDPNFRLEFLKQVMLNDNVYDMKTIEWFVDTFGFESEKEILFKDRKVYNQLSSRLNQGIQLPAYNLSGLNEKAVRKHKMACNSVYVTRANKENGIKAILGAFTFAKPTEFNPAF